LIKKLRRKFVLVIMSVVTTLLIAAFIALLITVYASIEQQTRFVLQAALGGPIGLPAGPGNAPDDRRKPSLTVMIDTDGTVLSIKNNIYGLSDEDAAAVTHLALASGKDSGLLGEYNLRYQIERPANSPVRLAFVDNTMEKSIINNLFINAALIGIPLLALLFAISLLLARWVVYPVEKAWNSQRQFIADASHELKTPLTVILSNAEMLAGSDSEDDKTKTRLENILEEARCMKALVDDMLSLARTEGVISKISHETIDFSAVLNNSVLIYEPILFDGGKRFDYAIEDTLFVSGNSVRLRQLTEILLDNAFRYCPPAGFITVSLKSGNKNEICLEITNEGETIPKEELTRIFERFYRLDKSRSSSGYGLGLAIAENIVRDHGGKIWAASEDNHITLCVTLPSVRKSS
jgi:signal transduction histidine kinase